MGDSERYCQILPEFYLLSSASCFPSGGVCLWVIKIRDTCKLWRVLEVSSLQPHPLGPVQVGPGRWKWKWKQSRFIYFGCKNFIDSQGARVGLGNRYAGQVDGQLGGLGPARFDVGLILITCEVIQMVGTALRVTGGTEMSTSQKWNL